MKKQKGKLITNSAKTRKRVWLFLCSLLLIAGLIGGVFSGVSNSKIEQVKAAKEKQKEQRKEAIKSQEKTTPLEQDSKLPGVALLYVGDNDKKDIKPEDIHNIVVVIFDKNNKKNVINLVAVQKEAVAYSKKGGALTTIKDSFDRDEPDDFYKALEKTIDYKVGAYIVYNNDTIKQIMDLLYIVYVNIEKVDSSGVDDLVGINNLQNKFEKKYYGESKKEVKAYGMQPITALQAVSYANLYYGDWDCSKSDNKHLYLMRQFIECIREANYSDIDRINDIIFAGDNDFDKDNLVATCVAIKNHSVTNIVRWTFSCNCYDYKKKRYAVPYDNERILKYIHKEHFGEKRYVISGAAKKYIKELAIIEGHIKAYFEKQKAKKESEKNRASDDLNNGNNSYSNNSDNSTSSSTSKNSSSKKKDSSKKKTETTKPSRPAATEPAEPEPTPQPEPAEPTEPADPGSTDDQTDNTQDEGQQ